MTRLALKHLSMALRGTDPARRPRYSLVTAAWALALGLVAGIGLGLVVRISDWASFSGPGWSLDGNGILSVLAVVLVAGYGGGWAGVAARVWWPRRLAVTLIAFGTTLLVAAAWEFSFLPPPLGVLEEAPAGAAGLATLVGLVLPRVAGTGEAVPRLALVAVGLLLVATLALAAESLDRYYWLVTPLLIDLPLLAREGRTGGWGWLGATCGAVVVGLVIGVLVGFGGA